MMFPFFLEGMIMASGIRRYEGFRAVQGKIISDQRQQIEVIINPNSFKMISMMINIKSQKIISNLDFEVAYNTLDIRRTILKTEEISGESVRQIQIHLYSKIPSPEPGFIESLSLRVSNFLSLIHALEVYGKLHFALEEPHCKTEVTSNDELIERRWHLYMHYPIENP